jgi:integrase
MLARFMEYLNGYPPSPELAKGFLSKYANRKPRTLARYSKMIGSFIKWYGEAWDYKLKIPKTLPAYVEDSDIEKLFNVIETKRTHRGYIVCDVLMTAVALKTGMRRSGWQIWK